jgi:hypothetical protein
MVSNDEVRPQADFVGVVEVAGVEPASSELLTGLLRAQPAR